VGESSFCVKNCQKVTLMQIFWWRISFEKKQVAKFLPFNFFWQQLCSFADREDTAGMRQ
jgi:hypothetical protein